ncbi:hypothetical protein [Pedobacter flavus]|uniref:Phenylalanyl-tRNA synthetase subunit beta n=1 Tax=Pedobacter flavus TaxID=3113906 RepID=A0ABU7H1M7_9SPHI|nr:hypothetical protein [Pedobacter sp. VNH31]MEE1885123.1 hypothetical protein [Pedobacter sp. VNH31]
MVSIVDKLQKITQKTVHLIELCNALQEENSLLKQDNERLRNLNTTSEIKVQELDEKLRVLKLAKSIEGSSEKSLDIKQKINEFVREIDRCVVLLKK